MTTPIAAKTARFYIIVTKYFEKFGKRRDIIDTRFCFVAALLGMIVHQPAKL